MQTGPETKQEEFLDFIGNALWAEENHNDKFTEQRLLDILDMMRYSKLPGTIDLSGVCTYLNESSQNLNKIRVDNLINERGWQLIKIRHIAQEINERNYHSKKPLLVLSKHKPKHALKKEHDNLEPLELVPYSEADLLLDVLLGEGNPSTLYAKLETLAQIEDSNVPPMPLPNALAIQGGGAKGAGYPRAKKALDNLGIEPKIISGASAGAITTAMLSFGLSGEQFTKMSQDMDFRDFCDYHPSNLGAWGGGTKLGQFGAFLWQNHVFTGEAFYDWIRGQVALNFGDPDITLKEVQEKFPDTPQMILMGTRVDPGAENKQVAFGAHDKRYENIKLADAVRASMSFPFAWDQFQVKNGNDQIVGTFTDGGVLNNLPIDLLSLVDTDSPYAMPQRQLGEKVVPINPRCMGWSLTSKLKNVRPDVTALTPRLKMLCEDQGLVKSQIKDDDEEIGKQKRATYSQYTRWSLIQPLKQNLFGEGGGTSQLDKKKLDAFKGQIAQMYTEGVDTLQFDVPDWQLEAIGLSCENAVYNSLLARMDPTQTYQEYFEDVNVGHKKPYNQKLFAPDSKLSNDIKKDLNDTLQSYFKEELTEDDFEHVQTLTRLLVDVYTELNVVTHVQKLQGKLDEHQNTLIEKFKHIEQNRRLKFLAHNISKLKKTNKNNNIFQQDPKVLELCMTMAQAQIQANLEAKKQRQLKLEQNMDLDAIATKINVLLDEAKYEQEPELKMKKVYLAETILKGQCSNILTIMERNPNMIHQFMVVGDIDTFNRILEKVRTTCHQLDQQGRPWPVSLGLLKKAEAETWENFMERFELLMQHYCKPSIFEVAVQPGKEAFLKVLLKRNKPPILKSDNAVFRFGSPLHAEEIYEKNALDYAIEANNPDAFISICKALNKEEITLLQQRNSQGETIAHTIINKASPEFIGKLLGSQDILKILFETSTSNEYGFCKGATQFGFGKTYGELCDARAHKDGINILDVLMPLCEAIHSDIKSHDINKAQAIEDMALMVANLEPQNNLDITKLLGLTGDPLADAHLCMSLLTSTNKEGKHLLMQAAESKNPKFINCVLEMIDTIRISKDDNLNALLSTLINLKHDRKSALYFACEQGELNLAEKLILQGADITHAGPAMGCASALTLAASKGHLDLVKLILNLKESTIYVYNQKITVKASRLLQDQNGNTPLHYLAANPAASFDDFMNILAKSYKPGAQAYLRLTCIQNADGLTPFDVLIDQCRLDIIEGLQAFNFKSSSNLAKHTRGGWYLDHYLDMSQKRLDGRTSLEVLFELANTPGPQQKDYQKMCTLVLENLSQDAIFRMDSKGRNILHYVVTSDFLSEVCLEKYLNRGLTKGMKKASQYHERTNTPDFHGDSPLIALLKSNNIKVLETFIKNNTGYFIGSGTWALKDYFNLSARRIDGMNDLEKAIYLKRTGDGKYDNIVDMLCKNVPSNLLVEAQNAVELRLESMSSAQANKHGKLTI